MTCVNGSGNFFDHHATTIVTTILPPKTFVRLAIFGLFSRVACALPQVENRRLRRGENIACAQPQPALAPCRQQPAPCLRCGATEYLLLSACIKRNSAHPASAGIPARSFPRLRAPTPKPPLAPPPRRSREPWKGEAKKGGRPPFPPVSHRLEPRQFGCIGDEVGGNAGRAWKS